MVTHTQTQIWKLLVLAWFDENCPVCYRDSSSTRAVKVNDMSRIPWVSWRNILAPNPYCHWSRIKCKMHKLWFGFRSTTTGSINSICHPQHPKPYLYVLRICLEICGFHRLSQAGPKNEKSSECVCTRTQWASLITDFRLILVSFVVVALCLKWKRTLNTVWTNRLYKRPA